MSTATQHQRDKLILSAPSSKIDAFMDDLPDFEGRSVIVFAVSRQLIMLLSAALEKKGVDHGLIVGNQHTLDRQEAIDEFQAGHTKFILATVAAGGTGINLTKADTVVYLQRSWSLIDMDQSMARAHRIGSQIHESILRIDYVAPGTFEEVVIARLERQERRAGRHRQGQGPAQEGHRWRVRAGGLGLMRRVNDHAGRSSSAECLEAARTADVQVPVRRSCKTNGGLRSSQVRDLQ